MQIKVLKQKYSEDFGGDKKWKDILTKQN
jgi:hypothetical protein